MEEKFPSSKREIVQLEVNVNELTYAALIACLRILLYLLMFPYNHQHISRQQLYGETQIWWHFGCYTNILKTNIPIMIDTLNEDFISVSLRALRDPDFIFIHPTYMPAYIPAGIYK